MDSAIISRIEHSLNQQLIAAIEDIVMSVMEDQLECHDFDTQYDAHADAVSTLGGDIEQLAENICESIQAVMQQRTEEVELMVAERFENEVLPSCKATYEKDGEVDVPARAEAYSLFVDGLRNDGEISEYEADSIDLDVESL
jgi:DNA repair exonuclease SbcCD ATPase subunit